MMQVHALCPLLEARWGTPKKRAVSQMRTALLAVVAFAFHVVTYVFLITHRVFVLGAGIF